MDAKDIDKMERTSLKRKFKEEVEEKMNFDVYCILCQTYGHIPSKDCVVRVVCLNCGFKGHVRRDCKKGKCQLKNIKKEEIKQERSNYENEYVEEEVPKDEPKNDAMQLESDSGNTEIGKDMVTPLTMSKEYIKEDVSMTKVDINDGESIEITSNNPKLEDKKKIKTVVYCNLCQTHGHILSEACVVNSICFVCGIKGHVRRDCKEEKCEFKNVKSEVKKEGTKYEEEYVEMEIKKDETKAEEQLKPDSEITEDEEDMISSLTTGEENNEMDCEWKRTHSLKRCSVNLHKTLKQYKNATRKSNRQEKYEDISYASQNYSYQSERKANFTHSLKKCTVNLPKVIKKQNEDDSSKSNRQVEYEGVLYSCYKCSFETKYKRNLTRHIHGEHEGDVYPCKTCSYEAKYKGQLTSHIQAKHEGVTFSCKKCSYEAKYKRALTEHIQVVHEGVVYSCKKCSFETKCRRSLTAHTQGEHEGVIYSCKKCSYETKHKGHLTRHIQGEHEGVVYPCKKCDYESKYNDNLKRHMHSVH